MATIDVGIIRTLDFFRDSEDSFLRRPYRYAKKFSSLAFVGGLNIDDRASLTTAMTDLYPTIFSSEVGVDPESYEAQRFDLRCMIVAVNSYDYGGSCAPNTLLFTINNSMDKLVQNEAAVDTINDNELVYDNPKEKENVIKTAFGLRLEDDVEKHHLPIPSIDFEEEVVKAITPFNQVFKKNEISVQSIVGEVTTEESIFTDTPTSTTGTIDTTTPTEEDESLASVSVSYTTY